MRSAAIVCSVLVGGMSCDFAPLPRLNLCPQTCGPFGTTNCCESTVVEGNAIGATRAREVFYRDHDNAADGMYPSTAYRATVSDFRLDTYLVTVGRFRAFVNAGMGTKDTAPAQGAGAHARIAGSGWDTNWDTGLADSKDALVRAVQCDLGFHTWTNPNDNLPMNCITWFEAMAFCIWDGGYLPSEAEWNYAASGGSEQRPYPWSASDSSTTIDCGYANYRSDSGIFCANGAIGAANRVGSESPKGDGRWGQADLAGNLLEWNLDWYNTPYPSSCDDCANLSPATRRVNRGGAFFSYDAPPPPAGREGEGVTYVRVASRTSNESTFRNSGIGVRCARAP